MDSEVPRAQSKSLAKLGPEFWCPGSKTPPVSLSINFKCLRESMDPSRRP